MPRGKNAPAKDNPATDADAQAAPKRVKTAAADENSRKTAKAAPEAPVRLGAEERSASASEEDARVRGTAGTTKSASASAGAAAAKEGVTLSTVGTEEKQAAASHAAAARAVQGDPLTKRTAPTPAGDDVRVPKPERSKSAPAGSGDESVEAARDAQSAGRATQASEADGPKLKAAGGATTAVRSHKSAESSEKPTSREGDPSRSGSGTSAVHKDGDGSARESVARVSGEVAGGGGKKVSTVGKSETPTSSSASASGVVRRRATVASSSDGDFQSPAYAEDTPSEAAASAAGRAGTMAHIATAKGARVAVTEDTAERPAYAPAKTVSATSVSTVKRTVATRDEDNSEPRVAKTAPAAADAGEEAPLRTKTRAEAATATTARRRAPALIDESDDLPAAVPAARTAAADRRCAHRAALCGHAERVLHGRAVERDAVSKGDLAATKKRLEASGAECAAGAVRALTLLRFMHAGGA